VEHGDPVEEAVRSLRALILAGERYRQVLSEYLGIGITEAQAISYLTVHGDRGQNELAADLGISSGASTALVDRLERRGIAERYPHPSDRRRTLVRLTDRGQQMVQQSRKCLLAGFDDVPVTDLELVAGAMRSIAARLSERSAEMARRCPAAQPEPGDAPMSGGVSDVRAAGVATASAPAGGLVMSSMLASER